MSIVDCICIQFRDLRVGSETQEQEEEVALFDWLEAQT